MAVNYDNMIENGDPAFAWGVYFPGGVDLTSGGTTKMVLQMDPLGRLKTAGPQDSFNNVATGQQSVSNPGTAVQLSSTTVNARLVNMVANPDNAGTIAYGGSGVDAAGGTGALLAAGDGVVIPVPQEDLSQIYIDATGTDDSVHFTYFY